MFFESATDQEANALSGRMFPHPPLMFVATATHLSVRALPTNERPASGTQLFGAPYWNTYEDGSICTGSMRVPTSEVSCSVVEEWERGFFESAFTHPSGVVRLTSYKGGIIPMWQSVLGRDAFPDQHLVPAHETVLQFIRRCQK
jgi:PRTRC genetic system protein B